ncbi:MAG: DeoR family transcriptional regulator [Candidatus Pacebacteria bacterium]|nr:DeoR family transcriptional regulator [Candidatus Paceibacterota bacterium]
MINIHLSDIPERVQKISTALYMITGLLDTDDPLRRTLRETAMKSLGQSHELSLVKDTTHSYKELDVLLTQIISYLDLGFHNSFFSEMNHGLLSKEVNAIRTLITKEIERKNGIQVQKMHIENLFSKRTTPAEKKDTLQIRNKVQQKTFSEEKEEYSIKDIPVFVEKKTAADNYATALVKKTSNAKPKKAKRKPKSNDAKEARLQQIMNILSFKKDASINDIHEQFKDCSSKTIQRDLNELIEENKVIKKGSRRWSTYSLA